MLIRQLSNLMAISMMVFHSPFGPYMPYTCINPISRHSSRVLLSFSRFLYHFSNCFLLLNTITSFFFLISLPVLTPEHPSMHYPLPGSHPRNFAISLAALSAIVEPMFFLTNSDDTAFDSNPTFGGLFNKSVILPAESSPAFVNSFPIPRAALRKTIFAEGAIGTNQA